MQKREFTIQEIKFDTYSTANLPSLPVLKKNLGTLDSRDKRELKTDRQKSGKSLCYNTCLRKYNIELKQSFAKQTKTPTDCRRFGRALIINTRRKLTKTMRKFSESPKRNSTSVKKLIFARLSKVIPGTFVKDYNVFESAKSSTLFFNKSQLLQL